MSLAGLWDKIWSWNVSQILVKFLTKRGGSEKWNISYKPFKVSQWAQGRGIREQSLPIVKHEETLRMQNYRPQIVDYKYIYICKCFNEPWLLHLPMDRGALNFLRCCLLGLKFNISKSTCIKWTLIQEEQRKTNLNIWKAVINGRHSQKDPSDTAIRRVIVPFPTRLWNGLLTTGNCIQQE